MNILLIITIISAVCSLVLGVYTLRFNPKGKANQWFAFFCFIISVWLIGSYFALLLVDVRIVRVLMSFAALEVLSLFMFTHYFANAKTPRVVIYLVGIIGFLNVVIAQTPFLFKDIVTDVRYTYTLIGWAMILFAPYAISISLVTFYFLARAALRNDSIVKRIQARYIAVGLILTMSITIFFNFIVTNVWHTTKFIQVGMLSQLIFISLTAYAMTRYRFLDVRVVVKKSLIYGVALFLFAISYGSVMSLLYNTVLDFTGVQTLAALSLSLVLFLLLFELVRSRVKNYLDGIFFRESVDFAKYISESGLVLNTTHELETFVLQFASSIQEIIQAPVKKIFVLQELSMRYQNFFPQGSKDYFLINSHLAAELQQPSVHGARLGIELSEKNEAPYLSKLLKKSDGEISVTVVGDGKVLALVLIGKHKNQRTFTAEDTDRLGGLIKETANRIPNLLQWQYTVESLKSGLLQK